MISFRKHYKDSVINEAIDYHISNGIPFASCIFRPYSESFIDFFAELQERHLQNNLIVDNFFDQELLESDIGYYGVYEGTDVPLDLPMVEQVELDSPKRGGPKKFYVYVKDGDNVKKITFGDTTGLDVNFDDEKARKSFVARHKCHSKTDKTTAGYWSCRLPYYAKQLGLKGGGDFFW